MGWSEINFLISNGVKEIFVNKIKGEMKMLTYFDVFEIPNSQ